MSLIRCSRTRGFAVLVLFVVALYTVGVQAPASAAPSGSRHAAYEPVLASSLNNLSNRLGEAGRREEAEKARSKAMTSTSMAELGSRGGSP